MLFRSQSFAMHAQGHPHYMSNTVTYKQKVSISFSPASSENFQGVLSDVYKVFVVKAVPAVPQIAGPRKNRYPLPRVRRLTEDAQRECKENRESKTGTLAELHRSMPIYHLRPTACCWCCCCCILLGDTDVGGLDILVFGLTIGMALRTLVGAGWCTFIADGYPD